MTINVTYISHLGSDLDVVNAARVSFDKESEWQIKDWKPVEGRSWVPVNELSNKDAKLIRYLADHAHWSPFSHCFIKFRVAAPIFVARQLQKHTVGLAWNEVSRRYVDSEPTFYVPDAWRKRAENVKQGSSHEDVNVDAIDGMAGVYFPEELTQYCTDTYQALLHLGVCPEQARMVLPQSMMTEWIWSGSLYAFARVCQLRLDSHTQYETRLVAEQVAAHCKSCFPVSWDALLGEDHGAGATSGS